MPTPFDAKRIPPAPILHIQLATPGEAAGTATLPALIDTGSDYTLVPLRYLLPIEAPPMRSAAVRGLFSERQLVTLYMVDLHLEVGVLSGLEVIGIDDAAEAFDQEEIILGRNALNKLRLLLDGPDQQAHLLERFPRRL